jgi:hypothetical protein
MGKPRSVGVRVICKPPPPKYGEGGPWAALKSREELRRQRVRELRERTERHRTVVGGVGKARA